MDGNLANKEMTWDDAHKFAIQLNQEKYAGYSDWRVPNKEELECLAERGKSILETLKEKTVASALDSVGFSNTHSSGYWSSTVYTDGTSGAWGVYFYDGRVCCYSKSATNYARCVRAG